MEITKECFGATIVFAHNFTVAVKEGKAGFHHPPPLRYILYSEIAI